MQTPERHEGTRVRVFFELAAKDAYWRAGAFGVPFCTIMGFVRREPVFLLGFGFFLALLASASLETWRKLKKQG